MICFEEKKSFKFTGVHRFLHLKWQHSWTLCGRVFKGQFVILAWCRSSWQTTCLNCLQLSLHLKRDEKIKLIVQFTLIFQKFSYLPDPNPLFSIWDNVVVHSLLYSQVYLQNNNDHRPIDWWIHWRIEHFELDSPHRKWRSMVTIGLFAKYTDCF